MSVTRTGGLGFRIGDDLESRPPCQPDSPLDRGTRVTIASGKYAGCAAIIEANVYGFSVDYPQVRTAGFQVTVLVEKERVWTSVRCEQVKSYGDSINTRGAVH